MAFFRNCGYFDMERATCNGSIACHIDTIIRGRIEPLEKNMSTSA